MRCTTMMLAIGMVFLGAASAHAGPVGLGETVAVFGTSSAARPELAGEIIYDVSLPFEFVDLFSEQAFYTGVLQNRVVRSDIDGTLDFYYRIRDTSSERGGGAAQLRLGIDYLGTTGFAGFATDADFRIDGLGTNGPATASRSADGDLVSFDFAPLNRIAAGEESLFIFIKTDATEFAPGGSTSVMMSNPLVLGGFAELPTVMPIPEPSMLCLLTVGGLALVRRRQRRM